MPLFLAWAVSVALAARAVVRYGFRRGGMVGSSLVMAGTAGLVIGTMDPSHARIWFAAGLAVCGLGMGPTSLSFILAVQNAVAWGQRGVATGAVTFLRTIGGAIGVGLLGAGLAFELAHRLAASGELGIDVTAALRPETHARLTSIQLLAVQRNLGLTLRDVYIEMMLLALGALFCARWLPSKEATLADSATHERAIPSDEGLSLAATEM
jgi:MFS family permease